MGQTKSRGNKRSKMQSRTKAKRFNGESMLDSCYDDIKLERRKVLPVDLDKPGMGQYYCVACARYFKDLDNLESHERSKPHKRRCKALQESPHRGEDLPRDF